MTTKAAHKRIRTQEDALEYLRESGRLVGNLLNDTPLEKADDGTLTVTFSAACRRCGGSGWIVAYGYVEGGICFDCRGANSMSRSITVTVKRMGQTAKARDRREKKTAEDREAAQAQRLETQRDWNETHGNGRITFEESNAIRDAKRTAENAKCVHVGTVGKREVFERLTIVACPSWEGNYGTQYAIIMKDAAGNLLVWITGSPDPDTLKGNIVTVKATVKEHGDRDGTKQTKLSRLVVTELLAETLEGRYND